MANGHGGARKGGGKPKGAKHRKTLEKEALRAYYYARQSEQIDRLSDAQMESACGVNQFVYRDDSGRFKVIEDPDELRARISMGQAIRLFTRLPNPQAQTDALNRLLDKPKEQALEVNIKGELKTKSDAEILAGLAVIQRKLGSAD